MPWLTAAHTRALVALGTLCLPVAAALGLTHDRVAIRRGTPLQVSILAHLDFLLDRLVDFELLRSYQGLDLAFRVLELAVVLEALHLGREAIFDERAQVVLGAVSAELVATGSLREVSGSVVFVADGASCERLLLDVRLRQ